MSWGILRYFFVLLLCGVLWCAPTAMAQNWELTTLDGSSMQQAVRSIDDQQVTLEDETVRAFDEFRTLKTPNALLGTDPTTIQVELHSGVVFARQVQVSEGVVTLETDLGKWDFDLFDIKCIHFRKEADAELQQLLSEPSGEKDRLLVSTSQGPRTVSGLVEAASQDSIKIDYQDQVRSIDREKVIALIPAALDSGRSATAVITCIDRSRLPAQTLTFTGQQWTLAWGGRQIELPASDVALVQVKSDREMFVSDLAPERSEVQTSLAPRREPAVDTNVFGQPITLRIASDQSPVRAFSKGIGTQAGSRLSYRIPAGSQRLTGWVGIDTSAEPHGDCICSILIDGIQVFSEPVSGTTPAVAIDLPLENAKQLELLVEPGPKLDLSDWVNWADLRFLK